MPVRHHALEIETRGSGTYELTDRVEEALRRSGVRSGLTVVFCPHTSCSLVLMENASPEARRDLEGFLDRLVRPDPSFAHNLEGPDDMPSHIKMALTRSSETIPIIDGALALGSWQGIYLWEHRARPHRRRIVMTFSGD